ncbi:T9SS type A sorting domain-containing protein [Gaetbulibacter saemankumensis]|uniref:T9SS type A sorting domain-containing protein n=1 Tax=Gaetbulibacter saemankumensis TaxID=311208 RepID=UPI0003FDFEA3|nr:T9SS type A sorting domain-containing protein [Gaetbulibacter saemankumensis]
MKQIYFLAIAAFFSLNQAFADPCPESGTTSAGGELIIFNYPEATSFCANRPVTIMVDGTTTYELDEASCSETVAVYNRLSGPAISGQDFTVTSGFDTSCTFSSGTLPTETFEVLKKEFKVFPNPLTKGNEISLSFGINTSVQIELYDITGKLMLKTFTDNQNLKNINVSGLTNGMYMIKINSGNSSVIRKAVILK